MLFKTESGIKIIKRSEGRFEATHTMFDDTVTTLDSLASVEIKLIEARILLSTCKADQLRF